MDQLSTTTLISMANGQHSQLATSISNQHKSELGHLSQDKMPRPEFHEENQKYPTDAVASPWSAFVDTSTEHDAVLEHKGKESFSALLTRAQEIT
jgi:hypothetical protein